MTPEATKAYLAEVEEIVQRHARDLLAHKRNVKHWAGKLFTMDGKPAGHSSVYAVIENKRPFGLRWLIMALDDTKDCSLLDELASRVGCFLVKRVKRELPTVERIVSNMAKLQVRLSNGGKVPTKDLNQCARDLLGYAELLTNNGKGKA